MRKIAMFAAFAAVAGAGVARAQANPPANPPKHEGRGPGGRGGPGAGPQRMLLKGITLTDAQKTQLQQLMQTEREQFEKQGGRAGNFDAIRTARQNGDTATANRLMAEQRAQMQAHRDQQITAIRALLTGDQLTQFDANVAEMKKHEAQMGPGGRGGPAGRGGRGRGARPPANS
jgi:Spy/CpxP family protein refolding chaperone